MGLMRKANSIASLGLVRFRTPTERAARYSRQTRDAVRTGNAQRIMLAQWAQQQQPAAVTAARMWEWLNTPGWVAPCGHPRAHWSVSPAGVASCGTCLMTVCPYCRKTAP